MLGEEMPLRRPSMASGKSGGRCGDVGVGAGNVMALRWAGNVEGADAKRCTGRRQEAATVTVSSVGGGRR
jgi:hypothetical protein